MNRYKILYAIGDGTYGTVLLAEKLNSGEKVAIKRMKRRFYSWEEAMRLKEVQSLKQLNHRNIIRLKEVIREHNVLYFIFEHMEQNLYEVMRTRRTSFSETTISFIVYQILQGLSYIHGHNFFHRDLKPENILCSDSLNVVKIADLGLAKEIYATPPYTDYVSTRWYRAPEVLLHSKKYGPPIDIWAMGCITCELYMLRPIFPGTSQSDQLYRICSILGTPDQKLWPNGYQLSKSVNYTFPNCQKRSIDNYLKNASYSGVYLVEKMLEWNPLERPTAQETLRSLYFANSKKKYLSSNSQNNSHSATFIEPIKPISLESEPKFFYKSRTDLDSILSHKKDHHIEELLIPLNHKPKNKSSRQFLSISRIVNDSNEVDRDAFNLGIKLIEKAAENSQSLDEDYQTIWKITW